MWTDLLDPGRAIRVSGWSDFFKREILPVSVDRSGAQYWPNYTLHLIGGGMSYRMMREWYEQHGSRHATALASATIGAYHLLNEVVENDRRPGPTTDAIADVMLFDPAGVAALQPRRTWRASSAGGCSCATGRASPRSIPATGAIENQGQNFSIKLAVPRSERLSFFYYFGNHGEGGRHLHAARTARRSRSAPACSARALVELGGGSQTADLVPSYGIFYDRHGSLLFSWTYANTSRYLWRANAYPGLLRVRGWTAGLFALGARNGETVVGLHLVALPLGVASRW